MKIILPTEQWKRCGNAWAKGFAFNADGSLLSACELAEYVSTSNSGDDLFLRLQKLNGLYSVVINSPKLQAAAVDPSRNFPIFFRYVDGEVIVSDAPYVLRQANDKLDERALAYYDSAGAVCEGFTLVEGLRQVKPGCLFSFGTETVAESQFFTMAVREKDICTLTETDFSDILDRVTQRFIRSLNGRQVVLPLTAGFDSRLIACLLHKADYKDVVCYTIGTDNSREVKVAKRVAEKFGFKHLHIDVTNPLVAPLAVMAEADFANYYRRLGAYGNFLWLYDYFAVRYLKENRLVDADACFAPGHSGDSIAGSHLTKTVVGPNDSPRQLAKDILLYNNEYGYRKELFAETEAWFDHLLKDGYLPYSAFQAYIFQNRQAHQIVNAARVYEHFGYELRMPLWDAELMDAMRRLPFECYVNRSFYNACLQSLIFKPMGVAFDGDGACVSSCVFKRQLFKKKLKHFLPNFILHYMTDLNGADGEYVLMQPLLKELLDNGVYASNTDCLSVNKTIRDWYLMKVKQDVNHI